MPELPEVQTILNTLFPRLADSVFDRVEVLRPDYVHPAAICLPELLGGRILRNVSRRGKRLIFTLNDSNGFLIHLGMTGRLSLLPSLAPRGPHTHLVLTLRLPNESLELHLSDPRRFGEFLWLGDRPGDTGLGVEPLEMSTRQLADLLLASRRPIKSLLLDQSAIAGLGNIYVDESLFRAGIHPLTPANALSESAPRLRLAIRQTLLKALRHRGSTLRDYVDAEGGKGSFQRLHAVYGRERLPCRVCRTPIQRILILGRSTCFCPQCQHLPTY